MTQDNDRDNPEDPNDLDGLELSDDDLMMGDQEDQEGVEEDIDVESLIPQDVLGDEQGASGVIKFYDKKYAVGLTWLTGGEDVGGDLVKSRAKKLEADFYCVRPTIVVQHGFGSLAKGHRSNMPAAAAQAADTLIGEWHGVFTTESGWWYVAVHADAVAPDGDILFESEEDAYNHYIEQSRRSQWPRSYAPETWNLPDTNGDISIEKLLTDMNRTCPEVQPWLYGYDAIKDAENAVSQNPDLFTFTRSAI